jgi:hypothetical protein
VPRAGQPTLPDQIRAIRGVTGVVRFGRDGRPWKDDSPSAEALAARGLYAALTHGAAIGEALGLGALTSATVQSEGEALVLLHSAGNHLCVSVEPGTPLAPVEAQLRALLTRPQGGR